MKYKKIRIHGTTCSGKSYLGKKLEDFTKIKLFSTDNFYFHDFENFVNTKPRDMTEANKLIDSMLKKKSWILEGMRYSDCINTFEKAELIIYIKPRTWRTSSRIILRDISSVKGGRKIFFKSLARLFWYNIRTVNKWQNKRPKQLKERFGKKVKVFSSADEAYEWVINNV